MSKPTTPAKPKRKVHRAYRPKTVSVRTLDVRPGLDEVIKPQELIQMRGHAHMTLYTRRVLTLLWGNAQRQGVEDGKDYTIALSELRPPGHKGNEEVVRAVEALMTTLLIIQDARGEVGRTQLLGGNTLTDKFGEEDRKRGIMTYGFDKRLTPLLRDSEVWARISIPALNSFGSKYALSLYENICQWSRLHFKQSQEMSIEEFRDMLGVEREKYVRFGNFRSDVLEPIVREINAHSSFAVSIEPIKTGRNYSDIRIYWLPKEEEP